MNLVVDIGNTLIKAGIFKENQLLSKEIFENRDGLKEFVSKKQFDNIIISTVKNELENLELEDSIKNSVIHFNFSTPIPIKNAYETPETLGADRLAAATGAFFLFPNTNCLTIDIGTCITYDFIDCYGIYQGGSISAGIGMKLKALHTFTSRLPLIEPIGETALIGKNTRESILSGVVNGTLAEIEMMIQNYSIIFDNFKVIICGGDINFFETRIKAPIFVIPELVLIGLNRILIHNVSI